MTKEKVLEALSNVQEPDLGKDLVTLNMVKDVEIEGNYVSFTVVLTTPACPLKDMIKNACINAIKLLVNKEAVVNVKFTSNTTTKRTDEGAVLPKVKNIIAVVSGKGGVGKSTVAANLALALAQGGAKVGLLDADIYGPSVPIMFGVRGQRPLMIDIGEKGMIAPLERYGIKLISIGLLVDEKSAVVWRGPMVSAALQQLLNDTLWDNLDVLVIDLPPGTGDIQLTLAQKIPVSGAIIVTTPQDVALLDARKAYRMFKKVNVPVLGIVENMSFYKCSQCGHLEHIFGSGGADKLAEEYSLEILGALPLSMKIREQADSGNPIVNEDPDSEISKLYHDIALHASVKLALQARDIMRKFPRIVIED